MMISALVLFMVNLLIASNVTSTTAPVQTDGVSSDFVEATTAQALRSIKNAEQAGADVSGLVERFNVAIDLLQRAENNDSSSCASYDECVIQANDMLLSIVDNASLLANQATARNEQSIVMMFTVHLPVSSFLLSVVIVVVYRVWKDRRIKKFQTMNIRQRSAK
ncbi:MAG: hypothetical protein ACREBU_03995 [Nitrososphaera sp.]